jgi:hypothetical protein
LDATGTRLCRAGDEFDVASGKEAAQIHFGMQHEAAAGITVGPKFGGGVVAGGKAVVSRADDSVIKIKGDSSHFAKGVL